MSSPWTGVFFTSSMTIIAMAIGKAAANLMGASLIWAFPIALPLIAIQMVGLARFARYVRRNDPSEVEDEAQLDLAA